MSLKVAIQTSARSENDVLKNACRENFASTSFQSEASLSPSRKKAPKNVLPAIMKDTRALKSQYKKITKT